MFTTPEGEPLPYDYEVMLRGYWKGPGLTGTGCYGEVRDMIYVMSRIATAEKLRLEIPKATAAKVTEEADASAANLPEGANW